MSSKLVDHGVRWPISAYNRNCKFSSTQQAWYKRWSSKLAIISTSSIVLTMKRQLMQEQLSSNRAKTTAPSSPAPYAADPTGARNTTSQASQTS
jgi:hypothetical protein